MKKTLTIEEKKDQVIAVQKYQAKMSAFEIKFEQITSIASAFVESKMLPQHASISSDHSAFLEVDGEKVITKCDKAIKAFNTTGLLKDRHVDDCFKVEPTGQVRKEMDKVKNMPTAVLIHRKEELERLVGVMTAQLECREAFQSAQSLEFVKLLVRKVQAKRGVACDGESETFKKMRADAQNVGFSMEASSGGGGGGCGVGPSLAGGGRGGASFTGGGPPQDDLDENGEEFQERTSTISQIFSASSSHANAQMDNSKACADCGRLFLPAELRTVCNPAGTGPADDFMAVCGECAVNPDYN